MGEWEMKSRGEYKSRRALKKIEVLPDYTMPHKYLPLVRGVPVRDHTNPKQSATKLPPISLPIEAQNSLAYHLEMVGLVHVDDLRKMADEDGKIDVSQLPPVRLIHIAPEYGPDIQLNPGTWMTPSEAAEQELAATPVEAVEVSVPEKTEDIENASIEELNALHRRIRQAKIQRLREQNVDAQVDTTVPEEGDSDSV